MTLRMPKNVLVTGAQGSLGSAVVQRFLKGGSSVFGTYLPLQPPSEKKGPENAPGLSWISMDITRGSSIQAGLQGLEIDALIHCAGGFRYLPAEKNSDEELTYLMDVNLQSSFLLSRELIQGMKVRNFGRLVFISSRATLSPPAGMSAYAASKAGINALTISLAEEVKSFDINVNALLPTVIDTPANRKDMPKADFSSWVTTEQLADIIYSLTQPWGKPIHGALIPVAGRV